MASQIHQSNNPIAMIIGTLCSAFYGLFFVSNTIFVDFAEFRNSAIKAIILSAIGWAATKLWEHFYKKYFKK